MGRCRGAACCAPTHGPPGARALRSFEPTDWDGGTVRLAQWARLLTPGRLGLRAGAWYSVVGRTPKEVQLAVRGRTVTVARTLVELRDTPPSDWTVVHPVGGRESYMVCPACRHRVPLPERHVDTVRCPRCNAAFGIAWGATRAPSPPSEGLRPDRRPPPRPPRAAPGGGGGAAAQAPPAPPARRHRPPPRPPRRRRPRAGAGTAPSPPPPPA